MKSLHPLRHLVLMVAGLAQLCGCSGAQILDLTIPSSGYSSHKDIAYGDDPRQKMDIYTPDNPKDNGGVIVFYYGGSWQKGSKDMYRFVAQTFASRGYVTVIVDYRLYPQIYYPAFVEDGANALAWVHENIGNYGGNKHNIFLSGHSAGAYIAMMLTLNESFLRDVGGSDAWIKGVMALAGPYDFLPFTDPKIKDIFSKMDDPKTQPINYVRKDIPPILLLSGENDQDVGVANSRHLARDLEKLGQTVTLKTYKDVEHIGIILALAHGFHFKAPTLEDMMIFLEKYELRNE